MKKFYIILAAAFVAAACNKEIATPASVEDIIDNPVSVNPNAVKVPVISGSLEGAEVTRSGFEIDVDQDNNPVLRTYWLAGDKIAVTDGESVATYTSSSTTSDSQTAASFTGDGTFTLENGLWAVYPSTSLVGRDANTLTVSVNSTIHQDEEETFDQWSINDLKVGYGSASGEDNVPSIHFRNLLTTLRVNLKLAANHGIDFAENEHVKTVTIKATGNENLAGDFSIPLSPDATEMTAVNPVSEIVCTMLEDTELSTDYKTSVFFTIAPGTYSQFLVSIRTNIRTIKRTISINTTLERNNFYDINLTKIKNASPYDVHLDIPVAEGGWGDNKSTLSKSSGAVIALWDGVYDDTLYGRYYTVQLATDVNFSNIVETTNIQITYSNVYSDEAYLDDGRITFCGLTPNTRYYYRVKVMGAGDEYYSEPNTFITTVRTTASAKNVSYYIDFDDIKCYGTGDFMGRAVGTYPGATPLQVADEADWNDRLGFVSTSDNYSYWYALPEHSAAYKVGSFYDEMKIGSTGNPNTQINYSKGNTLNAGSLSNLTRIYNRPGYIQMGTSQNPGSFEINLSTVSLARNKTTSATVKLKACAFNTTGNTQNAAINVNLYAKSSVAIGPCEIEGNATINIPYDSSYTWHEYTVTVTTNKTTDGTDAGSWSIKYDYPKVLTISTAQNGNGNYVRVFIDDVQISE